MTGLRMTIKHKVAVSDIAVYATVSEIQLLNKLFSSPKQRVVQAAAKATVPKQMWLSLDRFGGKNRRISYAQSEDRPLTKFTDVKTSAVRAVNNFIMIITVLTTQYS